MRSGHAKRQTSVPMLGEEMKTPCQAAGGLTDQGKERAFGFSSNTVITLASWTLIWECGGIVNPALQPTVTLG